MSWGELVKKSKVLYFGFDIWHGNKAGAETFSKKLSYRRGTARPAASFKTALNVA